MTYITKYYADFFNLLIYNMLGKHVHVSEFYTSIFVSLMFFLILFGSFFILKKIIIFFFNRVHFYKEKTWKLILVVCIKRPSRIFVSSAIFYLSFMPIIYYFINLNQKNVYYLHLLNNIFLAITILCVCMFFYRVIAFIRKRVKQADEKLSRIEDIFIFLLLDWLPVIIPILGGYLIIEAFDLSQTFEAVIDRVKNVLIIISIFWALCLLISKGESYVLSKFDITSKDNSRARGVITQVQVLKKILLFAILVVTVAFIFMLFDSLRHFGASLLASAGIAGVVASLAAQKTLSNLFVGFQLAITQPIRLYDVLVVEGEWGKVEEITLTYVIVAIWDQRRLVLPISYFLEKPFQNWTKKSADIIGTVFIYVDYFIPVDKIEEEVIRLCKSSPLWDKRVVCVQVTNASASNIEIRILASSSDSPRNFDLRCYLRQKIIEFIRENYPGCFASNRLLLANEEKDFARRGVTNVNHP